MLNAAQLAARDGKLTASRVAALITGEIDDIYDLWLELVGSPQWEPEDLSGIWAVQLGAATEQINLDWFARKHGEVSRRGELVTHANGWAACTLDGWSVQHNCSIECKHVGGREPLEVVIDRYQPQMHWQMLVTGAEQCALSVIVGANEPIVEFIPRDAVFGDELWARAEAFMQHVWNLTEPVPRPVLMAPILAEKTYDMSTSNLWATEAATWRLTRQARKDCEAAEKQLKGLCPPDAVRCHGHGIEIRRDRAGRLSLKELT